MPAKSSCGSMRVITWNCSRAMTTVAMVNRTAKNRKAEDSFRAFFTTTNVTPQISEQNISDKSAFFRASIRVSIHDNCPDSVSVIWRKKPGSYPPTRGRVRRQWLWEKGRGKRELFLLINGAAADDGLQNFH